ncbi:hypothetical protein RJ639_040012 [Escallonia herrerae]|uniref:Senescence-associated carboxylesterase 101 n=1 Tax=Escallonia herrerae TaxID=1293975 RepID=A0AA88WN24_9ASTE|nr:hypothetical protein RJ639_040012 [Escallonia herrerae]
MGKLPLHSLFCRYGSGLELANLAVSSDLLLKAWDAILEIPPTPSGSNLPVSVTYKVSQLPNQTTIVAFGCSSNCNLQHLQGEGSDLVSSPAGFQFVCTKVNPSVSIHKAATDHFASLQAQLSALKIDPASPLIITGRSLGGSIASLFTLWLLDRMDPRISKRPICVTFGSPLLGDKAFQQAISERATWVSCFLHIVSNQDLIPRAFVSPENTSLAAQSTHQTSTSMYMPFGTTLFCSESGCAGFEEPETILLLMAEMSLKSLGANQGLQVFDYGGVLKTLKSKAILRKIGKASEVTNPNRAGITLLLQAIGVIETQEQETSEANALITKVEKKLEIFLRRRKNAFDPNKDLNNRKVNLANMEWYKKVTTNDGGYYDSYKNAQFRGRDELLNKAKIVKDQRILKQYWIKTVEDIERKPQKEGASIRTRFKYGGTNYRRMVEPLDIAEYYSQGKKNYLKEGRSEHYKVLEQWLKDDKVSEKKQAVGMTEDSCFWAHVEEANISCGVLKDGETSQGDKEVSLEKMVEFENYMMNSIEKYSVSTEAFLEGSTFMKWWQDYISIRGNSYESKLTSFMKNKKESSGSMVLMDYK